MVGAVGAAAGVAFPVRERDVEELDRRRQRRARSGIGDVAGYRYWALEHRQDTRPHERRLTDGAGVGRLELRVCLDEERIRAHARKLPLRVFAFRARQTRRAAVARCRRDRGRFLLHPARERMRETKVGVEHFAAVRV